MTEQGFIQIQPRELYDALRRLETKVDLLATSEARINDLETRMRAVESKFMGVMVSSVTVVLGGIVVVLWKVLSS